MNLEAKQVKLYECLSLKKDMFMDELLDLAYGFLHNPILVLNSFHQIIGHRQSGRIPVAEWQPFIDKGYYDAELIDENFQKRHVQAMNSNSPLTDVFSGHLDYVYIIKHNGIGFGSLNLLEYESKISEEDLKLFKTLSDVLAIHMSSFLVNDAGRADPILSSLLNGQITNETELNNLIKTKSWTTSNYYRLLAFEPNSNYPHHLDNMLITFSQFFPDRACRIYNGVFLALEKLAKPSEDFNEINEFCLQCDTKCGVSELFTNLLEIAVYLRQCHIALKFSRDVPRNGMALYRNYKFNDWINQLNDTSINSKYFMHHIVQEIELYDRKMGTELGRTLYTYLREQKSISKTSRALFLHKNTINYRIARIKQLFSPNLDDFEEITHIFLSYRAKELETSARESVIHLK